MRYDIASLTAIVGAYEIKSVEYAHSAVYTFHKNSGTGIKNGTNYWKTKRN
jgi:hypothetical protein